MSGGIHIDRLVIHVSRPENDARGIAQQAARSLHAALAPSPAREGAVSTVSLTLRDTRPGSSGADLGSRIGAGVASHVLAPRASSGGAAPC